MNLLFRIAFLGAIFISLPSFAGQTFTEIELLWQQIKDKPGYAVYEEEFIQYNNHFDLDTKDGCFGRASGSVNMYLVITSRATIESVVTDIDNAKAQCFKHTYQGLPVKAPPFYPFIIKMKMAAS